MKELAIMAREAITMMKEKSFFCFLERRMRVILNVKNQNAK